MPAIFFKDVVIPDDKSFYLGDPNTDGTWRITISNDELSIERRESGSYVQKGSFTA